MGGLLPWGPVASLQPLLSQSICDVHLAAYLSFFFKNRSEGHCLYDAGSEAAVHAAIDVMKHTLLEEAPEIPLTANMGPSQAGDNVSRALNVQGFSHRHTSDFLNYHNNNSMPRDALVASECCSCENDRDESFPNRTLHYGSNAASCAMEQTQYALNLTFMVGTYTWTLFG